jgi:flavodoxin
MAIADGGYSMKGLVAYDSYYGNTKMVAIAIAKQIKADGHEAELVNLREGIPKQYSADFMFVGSPTRIGKMTRKTKKFIKKINRSTWGTKPIVAFDTYMKATDASERMRRWTEYGAGYLIHDMLKERGLSVRSPPLKCLVTDMKGPLAGDALDKAKKYTHDFIESLQK